MNLSGIHLTLMVGPVLPVPAPQFVTDALESIEITHNDEGRSGFQISFKVGRSGAADLMDYKVVSSNLLRTSNRVIVVVMIGAVPRVLMDGIITNHQFQPSNDPGASRFTVTGEDVSVMMDLIEIRAEHPSQNELIIVNKILLRYALFGIKPVVIPPWAMLFPNILETVPVQAATDLQYIQSLAQRYGYVFYVTPGPAPGMNIAYWGPRIRTGGEQRALTMNMGPHTNVESLSFQYNALDPRMQVGRLKDAQLDIDMPIVIPFAAVEPLSSRPALPMNLPFVRTHWFGETDGKTIVRVLAEALGDTNDSVKNVVTASGTVDTSRYGGILQSRALVGVRGAGATYDGLYYVKSVTHSIRRGEYKQNFSLSREGLGTTRSVVKP